MLRLVTNIAFQAQGKLSSSEAANQQLLRN
jgi:hypothetical protein